MHWTNSCYWRTMAFLGVLAVFALAWALGARRDLPVVQPAPAEDILIVPEATAPRLQIMTTADNGTTLIWWRFRKDSPETIELSDVKTFRAR